MLKTLITSEIINYCIEHGCRETSIAAELRDKTMIFSTSQMLITPLQGAFLKLITQISNANNVLEIGMFTGYSALWIALGLKNGALLTTLDISSQHLSLAQEHWQKAGVSDKITPVIAPAESSIAKLMSENRKFDIVFIDANKAQYIDYYESAIKLLNDNGLIIIDNVLMYGHVLDNNPPKNYIKVLQQLNELVKNDPRVDVCMLPIGDGMTIARKKDNA